MTVRQPPLNQAPGEGRFTATAPRWAGLETFVKNLCFQHKLECDVEIDKGWIANDYRISIRGDAPTVLYVCEAIRAAINS